jgi:dTDP-glucose pyrophosphorylase
MLVILAAGIGSRYGGLKQIDPIGANGELLIDYSIYDAVKAGFKKVLFIIKNEIKDDFMKVIGNRMGRNAEILYSCQEMDDLPPGYAVPEGRTKPWGTAHALMTAERLIDGPFAVINADDYYGPSAYRTIFDWLSAYRDTPNTPDKSHFAMVGYRIENTVSEHGTVARGVCVTDEMGYLTSIVERTKVGKSRGGGARFSEDDGASWTEIPNGSVVSMNFWGLNRGFFNRLERDFVEFLEKSVPANPMKSEFLLPFEINAQIQRGMADVKVLESRDSWFGVTYREDRAEAAAAIAERHRDKIYPTPLWG